MPRSRRPREETGRKDMSQVQAHRRAASPCVTTQELLIQLMSHLATKGVTQLHHNTSCLPRAVEKSEPDYLGGVQPPLRDAVCNDENGVPAAQTHSAVWPLVFLLPSTYHHPTSSSGPQHCWVGAAVTAMHVSAAYQDKKGARTAPPAAQTALPPTATSVSWTLSPVVVQAVTLRPRLPPRATAALRVGQFMSVDAQKRGVLDAGPVDCEEYDALEGTALLHGLPNVRIVGVARGFPEFLQQSRHRSSGDEGGGDEQLVRCLCGQEAQLRAREHWKELRQCTPAHMLSLIGSTIEDTVSDDMLWYLVRYPLCSAPPEKVTFLLPSCLVCRKVTVCVGQRSVPPALRAAALEAEVALSKLFDDMELTSDDGNSRVVCAVNTSQGGLNMKQQRQSLYFLTASSMLERRE